MKIPTEIFEIKVSNFHLFKQQYNEKICLLGNKNQIFFMTTPFSRPNIPNKVIGKTTDTTMKRSKIEFGGIEEKPSISDLQRDVLEKMEKFKIEFFKISN